MPETQLNTRLLQKTDTSANWASHSSFVPKKGEIIIYSDLNKFKVGDGTTTIANLQFAYNGAITESDILNGNLIDVVTSDQITIDDSYATATSPNGKCSLFKYTNSSGTIQQAFQTWWTAQTFAGEFMLRLVHTDTYTVYGFRLDASGTCGHGIVMSYSLSSPLYFICNNSSFTWKTISVS